MSKLKALIVDDEEAARDILSSLLHRSTTEFEAIETCNSVPEAVVKIKSLKPDVVFLDVQMPEYAGYEIIDFFDEISFEIIFVTAFDKYAIKAFELSAVDYLVKPIERSRLTESLEKLSDKLRQKTDAENYKVLLETVKDRELGKIVISELRENKIKKHVIALKDIIAFEAMRAYTQLYLADGSTMVVSRNIKQMEGRLPMDEIFLRCHRSWIINLDHVQMYNLGNGEVSMTNSVSAKLSKNSQSQFEERTSIRS